MARFDTSGLDEMIADMTRMGQRSGELADAMLDEGAAIIRDAWKETAERHKFHDTWDMIHSIGISGRKATADVDDIRSRDIYPLGKDRKGVRNAKKAFILHWGSEKRKIPRTKWADEADSKAEPVVVSRLTQMWGQFLESGRVPPKTKE